MGFIDNLNNFQYGDSGSDAYANSKRMTIEFFHLPSNKSIKFKAFLTSWDDKFTSQYNSEDVYGRNDRILTFQGTYREIAISWDVVAHSVDEGMENLARTSALAQFLYPAYKMESLGFSIEGGTVQNLKVGTMTKAPLVKVRFGNLIVDSMGDIDAPTAAESGLLCALDGLQITTDLDGGFFDGTGIATPKILKLSTNLQVLHQHTLGWDNGSKEWLGEGNSAGYPYNSWGDGASDLNTFNATKRKAEAAAELEKAKQAEGAAPDQSGAEAPSAPPTPPPGIEDAGPSAGEQIQEAFDDFADALRNISNT
jgi:hypothetical protein